MVTIMANEINLILACKTSLGRVDGNATLPRRSPWNVAGSDFLENISRRVEETTASAATSSKLRGNANPYIRVPLRLSLESLKSSTIHSRNVDSIIALLSVFSRRCTQRTLLQAPSSSLTSENCIAVAAARFSQTSDISNGSELSRFGASDGSVSAIVEPAVTREPRDLVGKPFRARARAADRFQRLSLRLTERIFPFRAASEAPQTAPPPPPGLALQTAPRHDPLHS